MELTSLLPTAQEMEIKLPDGSPTGIKFKVVGQDSKQFRDVAKKMAKGMLGAEAKPDIDALEQQNGELIAACIVGWSGLTENGEELAYSPDKAIELMTTPGLSFIREQVEGYATRRTNFFRSGDTPT